MRILLISSSYGGYKPFSRKQSYNGGGWISSLQDLLSQDKRVDLGIAFFMNGEPQKTEQDGVIYYPIPVPIKNMIQKIVGHLCLKDESIDKVIWSQYEDSLLKVIRDFNPDIIQVFGSEGYGGIIADRAGCPVVLHIQGLLNPYWNAYCVPFVSLRSFYFKDWNPLKVYQRFMNSVLWRRNCFREREILRRTHYFLGRTTWDNRVVWTYNKTAKYYYGAEILRPAFYDVGQRRLPQKAVLISTISRVMYKGLDMVMKTANLLKKELNLDFEWRLFGNIEPRFTEQRLSLNLNDLGITLCGVASAEQLREELLHCTLYVHPSYIDNSPNSLCEAQMLGVPVVATNVGGISSMMCKGHENLLVPSNDPYQAAMIIYQLANNEEELKRIGNQNRLMALNRHDRQMVVNHLISTFREIMDDYKSNKM